MPTALTSLDSHMARLRALAFHRFDACGETVRQLHTMGRFIDSHEHAANIWKVYDWLLCPLTLWAVDYLGLAKHLAATLEVRKKFDRDLVFLLDVIQPAPTTEVQSKIGEYEERVTQGRYDSLVKQPEKLQETDLKTRNDGELQLVWKTLKERFPLAEHQNKRGVVRRSLSRERNFEPYLAFNWRQRKQRFKILFDALCYRWILYGFEKDTPLLLKISVNPTPHGTMIVIPRHLSFDGARSLDWKAIGKLHKAHGIARQGPKLSPGRMEKDKEASKVRALTAEAKQLGLRGEKKEEFVLKGMNKDLRTDGSWSKRLLKR